MPFIHLFVYLLNLLSNCILIHLHIILSYWLWLLCMLYSITPSAKQKKFCDLILCRSSRPEEFCKKSVLRNFVKFIGKHLCQSLFFNKVAGLRTGRLLLLMVCHVTGLFRTTKIGHLFDKWVNSITQKLIFTFRSSLAKVNKSTGN